MHEIINYKLSQDGKKLLADCEGGPHNVSINFNDRTRPQHIAERQIFNMLVSLRDGVLQSAIAAAAAAEQAAKSEEAGERTDGPPLPLTTEDGRPSGFFARLLGFGNPAAPKGETEAGGPTEPITDGA